MRAEQIIEKNRKKLDEITKKMIKLIRERDNCVKEIGIAKRKLGLPIINRKRESEVIEKARKIARKLKVDPDKVEKIMKILIKHARKIEK